MARLMRLVAFEWTNSDWKLTVDYSKIASQYDDMQESMRERGREQSTTAVPPFMWKQPK
jgi:hypothetical protein